MDSLTSREIDREVIILETMCSSYSIPSKRFSYVIYICICCAFMCYMYISMLFHKASETNKF